MAFMMFYQSVLICEQCLSDIYGEQNRLKTYKQISDKKAILQRFLLLL